ncbi:hypothetical protein KEM52_005675 [Ascosphaera acerosa]|nr:hypothetical protein KEM52_005675 [Ascosphaera acerosa]
MSTSTDNTAAASPFSGFGGFGGFGGFSMSVNCDGSAGGNGRDGGNGRAPAPRSSGHAATEDPREHGRRAEEEDDDDPRAAGPPRAAADTSRSAAHLLPPNYGLARRTSVSAESLNPSTYAQDNWTPPVHPKTREQLARLKAAVQGIILFNSLDEPQMETILQALVEKPVPAKGIKIIAQGDQGDFFYVIETGSFDVYKHESGCVQSGPDGLGAKVATLKPGEFFGELALMYNAPRSASVVSADNRSTVWALDRITFRRILLDSAFNRRSMYEAFLEEVPILSSLKPYERSKIADALRTAKFKPGDTIIAEGEPGENFYLLESGTANAFKAGVLDEHVPVMRYQRGDYFGELALLDDKPRRATIVAETDVTVAMLHRDGFKRLLGPVQNIMRRTSYDAGRPSTAGSASPAAAARGKQEEEVTAGETEAAKNAEKDEEEAAAKRNSNSKEKEIEAALQVDGAQDCPADGAAAQDQAQAQAQAQGQADRDDAAAARGKTPTPTVEVGKKRLRASPDSTEEGS